MSHKIFTMSFNSVYKLYIQKAERKNRTKEEVDEIILWLTGYDKNQFYQQLELEVDFQTFFDQTPNFNPNSNLVTGVVCGIRVENVEDPLMKKIRILDKLIDELAKGKTLDKIKRKPQ